MNKALQQSSWTWRTNWRNRHEGGSMKRLNRSIFNAYTKILLWVLQTRTLHCSLHESSTTIFQHWCKDLASEHTCNLMTISIHSCKQQPLICLGCYCIIQPTLVVVKILQGLASGLTIYIIVAVISYSANWNIKQKWESYRIAVVESNNK